MANGCLGLIWCGYLSPGWLDTVEISVYLVDVGNLWCPFFTGCTGRRRLGVNKYGRVAWRGRVGVLAFRLLWSLRSAWLV